MLYRSLEEAVGPGVPSDLLSTLTLLEVPYWSYEQRRRPGQIIVASDLADEVEEIFFQLTHLKFPIFQVVPIWAFGNSDHRSMEANNTSGFNLRYVEGTKVLSQHALGRAIDINPHANPCLYADGRVVPANAYYHQQRTGTLYDGCKAVRIFTDRGWTWGGHWTSLKDYQHFEKKLAV